MPLHLIHGPPNSGRTDKVQQAYLEVLPRRPVLVVPSVDDIFGWERRLTEDGNAVVGGQILHFKDLYTEILELDPLPRPKVASQLQRSHLVERAIRSAWPDVARRLTDQPGLVDAVLELIDDFRNEMVDVTTLESRINESGLRHLHNLTSVYSTYMDLLKAEGLTDLPEEARFAIENVQRLWQTRPVMIAGFDEMTGQQLEMVRRLAFEVEADVTVAVTFEKDSPALALTGELVEELRSMAVGRPFTQTPTSEASEYHDRLLVEIADRFLKPEDPGRPKLVSVPGDAFTVLTSTGQRNEAEAIAVEIAKLVSTEAAPPEDIAVAIESPSTHGRFLRDTLERYDIPVTLEGETSVDATVTGRTLISLLSAVRPGGPASALLAYLRSPIGPDPSSVDQLERSCRIRGLETAIEVMEEISRSGGDPPPHWEELTTALAEGRPVNEIVSEVARKTSLAVLALDIGATPSPSTLTETQAGAAIARASDELAAIHGPEDVVDAITRALVSGAVKVWAVPAQGTVRIASPYSLRAKRVQHLFFASLQEAGMSDADRAGPFLSATDRSALGMSDRRDAEVQQRYLLYSCMTVPTNGLWLSCRNADEIGKAERPSPLIGAVTELFDGPVVDGEVVPQVNRGGRTGSEITMQPADSPSAIELARSLAPLPAGQSEELVTSSSSDEGATNVITGALEGARDAEERTRKLSSLDLEPILEALGESALAGLGATEIEAYAGCPYRWFIERQLNPRSFEPDPDYLSMGSLLHDTLEDLYSQYPGQIPRPDTIGEWTGRVPELVLSHSKDPGIGLGSDSVSHAALRSRATQLILAHLGRESRWEDPRHLPAYLEASFGTRSAENPAVQMGEGKGRWALKGKIDRIDMSPDQGRDFKREAIAIDYKSGSVDNRSHHTAKRGRKVQVQLYLHAIQTLWTARTMAGIYVPIGTGSNKSRGAFSGQVKAEMLDRGVIAKDQAEDLDKFIEEGVELANLAAADLIAGILEHDPVTCPDHFDHPAVPDRPGPDDDSGSGS